MQIFLRFWIEERVPGISSPIYNCSSLPFIHCNYCSSFVFAAPFMNDNPTKMYDDVTHNLEPPTEIFSKASPDNKQ
jgi:hypothetical protein